MGPPYDLEWLHNTKLYMKLHRNLWFSYVPAANCVQVIYRTSNIGRLNIRKFEMKNISRFQRISGTIGKRLKKTRTDT